MLISVIVPVYNVFETLERTVDSLTSQKYRDIEIILVDDGSTDGSGTLADRLSETDDRIRVIHQPNAGLSEARNMGIAHAKGEYIAFLDSDDTFTPTILESFIKSYAEVAPDAFIFNLERKRLNGTERQEGINGIFHNPEKWIEALFNYSGVKFYAANKIFKRDLFKDVRFPAGKLYEDTNAIYDALKLAHTVVITDIVGMTYYQVDESITNQRFTARQMDNVTERLILHDKIKQDFPSLIAESGEYILDGILSTGYKLVLAKDGLGKNFKNYDKQLRMYHDAHKKLLTSEELPWQKRAAYILYCQSPVLYQKLYRTYLGK